MPKQFAVAAILLFTVACASMKSESGLGAAKVDVVEPDIQLVQLSSIPSAARHVTGGLPIQFGVRVTNRAAHPILLKRVAVVSMGDGAYNLAQSSHPFKIWIAPAEAGEVKFWAPANIDSAVSQKTSSTPTASSNSRNRWRAWWPWKLSPSWAGAFRSGPPCS